MSTDAVMGDAQRELVKRLHRAGLHYVSEARQALNQAQPYQRTRGGKGMKGLNPSLPGRLPKKLRGELQRSMAYEVKPAEPSLYLGTSLAGHPAWLQFGTARMAPRPWLTLIWARVRQQVRTLLGGGR